jgi:signal transduction histidine kinase/ligand-binding sensor domain-containing protein
MVKKRRSISYLYIVIFVLNLFINDIKALAYDSDYKFTRISIEDGLSQSSVEAIFQDSKGYMWFGTSDGLNRFDGHNFTVYRYKLNDDNSLTSNYVDSIVEDEDGMLWIGTSKGLNKLDPATSKIERYTYNSTKSDDKKGLSHYNIWTIMIDRNGDKWIGTEYGLNKYDKNTGSFTKYFSNKYLDNTLSDNFVTSLCEDNDGLIWVGTRNGLNIYNPKTNKFTVFMNNTNDENSISDSCINKIYKDSKGDIWVATNQGGLNKYNKENHNFIRYTHNESDKSIPSNTVQAILEDSKGNFWIGTKGGLSQLNRETGEFTTYSNKFYDQQSLSDNNVLSIYEDRSGMIWIGTYRGINIINSNSNIKHYKNNPMDKNSINDNVISGITEDEDGVLWIGTKSGGLNSIDRKTGQVNHYLNDVKNENSLSSNDVYGVTKDRDGELWIATSNGLNRFNKKNNKFTRYYSSGDNSLVDNNVRFIYQDRSGIIWIGTRNGLCSYDKNLDKFQRYNDIFKTNGINDFYISSIYEDSEGTLWLGCAIDGGLISFNRKNNTMISHKYDKSDNNTISFNSIKAITEDGLGNLWIATNHGLNKYNIKNKIFTRYTEENGLANNFVYGVLIDKENNPWASTNGGISKLNVTSNNFENYTVTDGLQSNEFNGYSYFKSEDGEMFFGGINGLNSFYPDKLIASNYMPKVVIENIKVFDKSIPIDDSLSLKYNEKYFSLEFFLPDFRNTNKTKYEYMLEGVDKDWISSDGRNYASYTNIKDGQYSFKVRARNSNGVWSVPTVVKIKVETPPWRTWWAYCFYYVILLIIIYLVWNHVRILENLVKQRTNQLNKKLEENKKLYSKLIKHEKYKNNYFVNLSHELRTPLNVIISTVQLLTSLNNEKIAISKENLNKYIDIINRNSKSLLKIINNLIDTSKIEAGSYKINPKPVDIVYVVEEAVISMKDFIESNGLEFIIDTNTEEKIIECDDVEIERCIINLLSNAVKFTPKGGTIYVNIYDKENWVEIMVKDTGIGIPEEQQEIIFNRFGQADNNVSTKYQGSGIGLTLVKSLVEIHGGSIKVNSKLNEGSEFIITLPVKHQNSLY